MRGAVAGMINGLRTQIGSGPEQYWQETHQRLFPFLTMESIGPMLSKVQAVYLKACMVPQLFIWAEVNVRMLVVQTVSHIQLFVAP